MSEILFKRLNIENFLSIGEGSLDLNNRGLLLIQGANNDDPSANSNGAGKSSTVDALCWALYGTTARGKSGDGVVNRFEGKNCKVEVTFDLNGKTYTVTRYRKHGKGKNRLTFMCGSDDLTLGTDKLTQDAIEKTIGCNLDVFTASIYAGQNSMPNLPAMTDKELKQLVEKAAGIELLDAAYAIARERLRSANATHELTFNNHSNAARNVEDQKGRVLNAKSQGETWDKNQVQRIHDEQVAMQELMLKTKALKAEVEAAPVAAMEANIKDLEQKLVEANKPLPELVPPERPVPKPIPTTSAAYWTAKANLTGAQNEVKTISEAIQFAVKQIRELDELVGNPCGECGRAYHKEDLTERRRILMEEARGLKEDLAAAQLKAVDCDAELQKIQQAQEEEAAQITEQNDLAEEAYRVAQESYQNALQARRDAQVSSDSAKLMDALKEAQNALQSVSNKKLTLAQHIERLRERKATLDRLTTEANPHLLTIEAAEKELERLERVAAEMQEKAEAAGDLCNKLTVVAELFSPKGMRGEVLDSVTPFLNARTSQYLGALSDGSITAEWKTVGETGKGELREKFHIAVQNTHGSEDFEGLSGGEQRKVRIATAMALQDLVASRADRPIKLFIADEADDALDVSGLERLMGVLDDKARHVGTVLIISHNDLADWVSNQVTVMKSGGKSHIVEL